MLLRPPPEGRALLPEKSERRGAGVWASACVSSGSGCGRNREGGLEGGLQKTRCVRWACLQAPLPFSDSRRLSGRRMSCCQCWPLRWPLWISVLISEVRRGSGGLSGSLLLDSQLLSPSKVGHQLYPGRGALAFWDSVLRGLLLRANT